MKKLFTIAILGLLSTGAFAQTSQGTKVVSGDLSLSISTYDQKVYNPVIDRTSFYRTNGTAFRFAPGIGYFIKDNLRVGAYIGYGLNNYKYISRDQSTSSSKAKEREHIYQIGASIVKYYMLTDKFAFTTTGGIGFENRESKADNNPESSFKKNSETLALHAGLTPGLVFFPSEKVSAGMGFGFLGYRSEKSTNYYETSTHENSTSSIGLDLRSSTWVVNFSYHFNR
jgi:hypothetical protein